MRNWSAFFLILSFVLATERSGAAPSVGFDLEVQVCADGSQSLAEFEGQLLGQSPQAIHSAVLSPLSPARAAAYDKFTRELWPMLHARKGATLRPRYPSTALLQRADCHTEVAASILYAPPTLISGELNSDLWLALRHETQQLLLSEAYLNFERVVWAADDAPYAWTPIIWNPTLSREFLYRWATAQKPRDLFALAREIELPFIEQSGFILPVGHDDRNTWDPQTGLVTRAQKSPLFFEKLWRSEAVIGGSTLPHFFWHGSDIGEGLSFHDDGSFHCGPLESSKPSQLLNITTHPVFGASAWGSHRFYSWSLCVSKSAQIEQGYLWVPWDQPKIWRLNGNAMQIRQDPLAGGTDQGTQVSFYPDQSVKLIMTSQGQQQVQGKQIEVHGPLLLGERDLQTGEQRLVCSGLPLGSRWRLSNGQTIAVKDRTDYFCSQVPLALKAELQRAIGSSRRNVYELR